jgi:membrane protease YdiL (CAAX protease family)
MSDGLVSTPLSVARDHQSPILSGERHSFWKSIVLHLSPGLLALIVFSLLARPVEAAGFPSIMPWLITVLFVNIPFELGYLLYQGVKRNGCISLDGIILYRQPLAATQIACWMVLTIFVVVILFLLSTPLTFQIKAALFSWVPDWFVIESGSEGSLFSKEALLVVNIASIFVFIIGIPIVEEMYFRGYLLPRLSHLGGWAILLNSVLFALYHFTTPWLLLTRTLITLPLAYTAYRKKNIIPSILVHALANSVDVIAGFLSMTIT